MQCCPMCCAVLSNVQRIVLWVDMLAGGLELSAWSSKSSTLLEKAIAMCPKCATKMFKCANVQLQSVKSVRCAVSGVRVAGVPSGPQGKQTKRICCDWGGKYPPPKKLKPDFSRSIKGQKGGQSGGQSSQNFEVFIPSS